MAREPFNPRLIQTSKERRPSSRIGLLTVSQVTGLVKDALDAALPPTLHVAGEISNLKRHSSGHLYLTLKDRFSELACVMWRSSAVALQFTPEDGMAVTATGRIEVFERAGRYQLYIRKLEPRGIGALELAFRQLCDRLAQEGLFDPSRKRPLPPYPERIVLVTSPTGAAVADMLRTLKRRYPCVHVLVYPVRVQGEGAAQEIAAAVQRVNANDASLGGIDVMIVGRGGGSLEDLWAFNEEVVARAIFASRVPIVSAVGHEVDTTMADLVADVRAATPTAAAELAVPLLDEVQNDLREKASRLARTGRAKADLAAAVLSGVLQRPPFHDPVSFVNRRAQWIDELENRIHRALIGRVHAGRSKLSELEPAVQRIMPHAHLLRRAIALTDAEHRLHGAVSARRKEAQQAVERGAQRLRGVTPANVIRQLADRLERVSQALRATVGHRLSLFQEQLRRQEEVLTAMSYKSVLGRGFSITRTKKGRRIVRSTHRLEDGQRLVTQLTDGEFESEVVNLRQRELFG